MLAKSCLSVVAGDGGSAHRAEGWAFGGAKVRGQRAAEPEGAAAGRWHGGRSRADTERLPGFAARSLLGRARHG